jgi:hypothetical protein
MDERLRFAALAPGEAHHVLAPAYRAEAIERAPVVAPVLAELRSAGMSRNIR